MQTVLVPPCPINPGGVGIVRAVTTLWAAGERMRVYTVEVAGDVLWYAAHEMEAI